MNLETTNFAGFRFDTEKILKVSYLTEKMLHASLFGELGYRNWLSLKKRIGWDLKLKPFTIQASALPTELPVYDSSKC